MICLIFQLVQSSEGSPVGVRKPNGTCMCSMLPRRRLYHLSLSRIKMLRTATTPQSPYSPVIDLLVGVRTAFKNSSPRSSLFYSLFQRSSQSEGVLVVVFRSTGRQGDIEKPSRRHQRQIVVDRCNQGHSTCAKRKPSIDYSLLF